MRTIQIFLVRTTFPSAFQSFSDQNLDSGRRSEKPRFLCAVVHSYGLRRWLGRTPAQASSPTTSVPEDSRKSQCILFSVHFFSADTQTKARSFSHVRSGSAAVVGAGNDEIFSPFLHSPERLSSSFRMFNSEQQTEEFPSEGRLLLVGSLPPR